MYDFIKLLFFMRLNHPKSAHNIMILYSAHNSQTISFFHTEWFQLFSQVKVIGFTLDRIEAIISDVDFLTVMLIVYWWFRFNFVLDHIIIRLLFVRYRKWAVSSASHPTSHKTIRIRSRSTLSLISINNLMIRSNNLCIGHLSRYAIYMHPSEKEKAHRYSRDLSFLDLWGSLAYQPLLFMITYASTVIPPICRTCKRLWSRSYACTYRLYHLFL